MSKSYQDALNTIRANDASVWAPKTRDKLKAPFAAARIHEGLARLIGPNALKIKKDAAFFCIGSCFAREIEDAIEKVGMRPLTKSMFHDLFDTHPDLFEREDGVMGRPTAFLNRYNLGSMADLMAGLRTPDNSYSLLYPAGKEVFHDYHFSRFLKPKSAENCLERRRLIEETYRAAASAADVFVFTFGLCESFFDKASGRYLNVTPDPRVAAGQDLAFRFLSLEDNLAAGQSLIDIVTAINPEARIVLTVSPVPLDATFTEHDVIIANTLAKSTLVLTAHTLVALNPACAYFPSYEMVMNSAQHQAWLWDKKHVAEPMVDHIMRNFIDQHVEA